MRTRDEWLKEFFALRGIDEADGRMLYGYRLSKDEYLRLQDNLKEFLASAEFGLLVQRNLSFCAKFALYAAEWWHREYRGGAWRWSSILESLGVEGSIDANARTDCVTCGLYFWGHRPSGSGKKFLGAIVAHGGLPLKALGQGLGKLSSILRSAIALGARFHWSEEQLVESIGDRSETLPDSLQRPEIYQLLAQIVLTALELRRECDLAGSDDVLCKVSQCDPRWMERFPISLEEGAAKTLLSDLIKEAASQTVAASANPFVVERCLIPLGDDNYELHATLSFPRVVRADELSALFLGSTNEIDKLPRYFSIDVITENAERLAEGRLVLGSEEQARLDGRKRVFTGDRALSEVGLILREHACIVSDGPVAVAGGAAVPVDLPWIIAERDGKKCFLAAGGGRFPDETVLVAVPQGWAIYVRDVDSPAPCVIGRIRLDTEGCLNLYEVRGSIETSCGDLCFPIHAAQTVGLTDTFVWEGKRLSYQPLRYTAFRGVPKLFRIDQSGIKVRVSSGEITWKQASNGKAMSGTSMPRGLVDAYVQKNGDSLARYRMLIVDERAELAFSSGDSLSDGSISFDGWGVCDAASVSNNVQTQVTRTGNSITLTLKAEDLPPESIRLALLFPGGQSIFDLPFPSQGAHFFNPDGKLMKDREAIALSALVGTRLRIFDRNPMNPAQWSVEISLICNEHLDTRKLNDEQLLSLPSSGIAEVRLLDYANAVVRLLGFAGNLDAYVRLSVKAGQTTLQSVHVCRYAVELERTRDGEICLSSNQYSSCSVETLEGIRVIAAQICNPTANILELSQKQAQGVPTGAWDVSHLCATEGPWLVFPCKKSSVLLRPLVIPGAESAEASTGLAMAMGVSDFETRQAAIACAVEQMTSDFSDSSWITLEGICQTFGHLPLSAVDVFRVIASRPKYAVAFSFRFSGDELNSLCERLESDLGFVWELTSIEDWVEAGKRLRSFYEAQLGSESLQVVYPMLLGRQIEQLKAAVPSIGLLLDISAYRLCGNATGRVRELLDTPRGITSHYEELCWRGADSLLQKILLRSHTNGNLNDASRWPEQHFFEEMWGAFVASATEDTKAQVRRIAGRLFATPQNTQLNQFKVSAANTPVLCALWSATGTDRTWWKKAPASRLSLRKLKHFDPEWFRQAYDLALSACIAFGVGGGSSPAGSYRQVDGRRVFVRCHA